MNPQARYESILLAKDQPARPNGSTDKSIVNDPASEAVARAALAGMLDCSIFSSENLTTTSSSSIASLRSFRDRVVREGSGGSFPQKEDCWSSIVDLYKNLSVLPAEMRDGSQYSSWPEVEVDVDGFFEEYPEFSNTDYKRKGAEEIEESDGSTKKRDDSPVTNGDSLHLRRVSSPIRSVRPSNQSSWETVPHTSYNQDNSGPSKMPRPSLPPHNPYQKNPVSHPKQLRPKGTVLGSQMTQNSGASQNPYHQNTHPRRNSQSHPQHQSAHPSHEHGSAWDDHNRIHSLSSSTSKPNPFQTARDYSLSEDPESETKFQHDSDSHNNRKYQYPENNDREYNPQGGQIRQTGSLSPDRANAMRGGHKISANLKRKFQPPKKITNSSSKKSSTTNASSSRQSSSSSANDSDDDLPEALKGLDKELVEKIQNEIIDNGQAVTFDSIAGLADAKQTVLELVCWPMKRPDLFTGLRRGPNGLLLFGPPGTGKTLIGKAIAYESGATFFSISSSSLTSKWIGEGEKLVRTLFAVAAYREPAVVFIDEIDSLLTQRKADENEASRRIKTEFLVQLDGTGTSEKGMVLIIGATNRPNELDDAARRRFVKRLYIPLPTADDRGILLSTLLKSNKHNLTDSDVNKLAHDTKGFSGADLKSLSTDAALGPIRQLGVRALEVAMSDVPPISYRHFRQALRGMRPSVAEGDLELYLEFNRMYGSKCISECQGDSEESDCD